MWHMTRDMWHKTCDMWHVTHVGVWNFSQNFNSPDLRVSELCCLKYISTNHQLLSEWVTSMFMEQPRLDRVCLKTAIYSSFSQFLAISSNFHSFLSFSAISSQLLSTVISNNVWPFQPFPVISSDFQGCSAIKSIYSCFRPFLAFQDIFTNFQEFQGIFCYSLPCLAIFSQFQPCYHFSAVSWLFSHFQQFPTLHAISSHFQQLTANSSLSKIISAIQALSRHFKPFPTIYNHSAVSSHYKQFWVIQVKPSMYSISS